MENLRAETVAEPPTPSSQPVDRERLLTAMISLCQSGHGRNSPKALAMIEQVFLDLVQRTERDLRLRLAHQLAAEPWAPSGLINALALDDIEIARPVIAKSPVLQDHDLIRVLTMATLEHQIEVARRPSIGDQVVTAILDQADPAVLTALLSNDSLMFSDPAMARLVNLSQRVASLRSPLSRHPQLTAELACTLYTWVGETLKGEIMRRFQVDGPEFQAALRRATAEGLSGAPTPEWRTIDSGVSDRRDMETRLVAKLEAAGELRPGFLLRSLREEKLHLFQLALASLASLKTEQVQAATDGDRPERLALACAAVGIDRSVFPTILALVRRLNRDRPADNPDTAAAINAAFSLKTAAAAISAFRVEMGAAPAFPAP